MANKSLETLRIMAGFESRLNTLLRLETTACGHEENITKADKQRAKLESYLESEIEKLVKNEVAK
jgi:hypothetical protein